MLIKLGNWLFHYRNLLFPFFYAALFIPSPSIFPGNIWAMVLGSTLIGTGIAVRGITIGLVYIIRGGNKRQIHAETLVTEGIYQICRNPMYLGNILLIFGFGIFANSIVFLAIFSPLFLFFYLAIIKAEENFLSEKFEAQFDDYKKTSNALLPKLSLIKKAIAGHSFNFKRVISKEHNSLFLYGSGIILLLYTRYPVLGGGLYVSFAFLLFGYLLIKSLKRRNKL